MCRPGLCFLLLAPPLLLPVRLCADYRIGQAEAPAPVVHEDAADFEVYPGHPRLFFRDTDLPEIRRRIAGDYADEWRQLVEALEMRAMKAPPETYARGAHLKAWTTGRNVAFAAVVTGEERYRAWAKRWAGALAASGPVGNDSEQRGRLQSLAVAYDWLYSWLSTEERQRVGDAIVEHLDALWYFANRSTNYVSGHSRWGNMTLAAGFLALVPDRPGLRERLLVVRDHWVHGYFPAQGWIAKDGGYHMGWAYSSAYLTGGIHNLWSSATNESVYFPWQALTPLFWLYGRQGDGTYPNTGDAYSVLYDLNEPPGRAQLQIAAGILKNPYAAGEVRRGMDPFPDILYGDKRVRARLPDDLREPLPLSRHFENSGVVIARDSWGADATVLQFRSVPFYSANHHHRDENSFTLHYRGGLAIDSGIYDASLTEPAYGGTHWLNYFSRTIAHNAIVVFDPEQRFDFEGRPISNDGGQPYRRAEPRRLEDLVPGGSAALDGITAFRDTRDYTVMAGDATRAYDPERVRLAQREIVYLRDASQTNPSIAVNPIVVVFDRVESANPSFKKKFLLHTVNEPALKGNFMVTDHAGGRLSTLTLLPENARLELVGGPGREAWVDGKNYSWDPEAPKVKSIEPGAWRLEVSPSQPAARDYFLHVLFVDPAHAPAVDPASAKLARTDGRVGVTVSGWRVMFPLEPGGETVVEKE